MSNVWNLDTGELDRDYIVSQPVHPERRTDEPFTSPRVSMAGMPDITGLYARHTVAPDYAPVPEVVLVEVPRATAQEVAAGVLVCIVALAACLVLLGIVL